MNWLFAILFILSSLLFLIFSPESFIEAITKGSNEAITIMLKTMAIYGFWTGLMKITEETGMTSLLSKALRPLTRLLIGKTDEESEKYITLNLSCNMLGLGNMATPLGIKGMQKLCEEKSKVPKAAIAFFALNASSIQIVPTTVITLRSLSGSKAPYDILLPSLLVGLITTILSVVAVKVFVKE